jgi:hypothetical protein
MITGSHQTNKIYGWFDPRVITMEQAKTGRNKPKSKNDYKVHLVHIDGREFFGTAHEFKNLMLGAASLVVGQCDIDNMASGKTNQWKGWYRKDVGLKGWASGRKTFIDPNIYKFKHDDGREVSMTQREFAVFSGTSLWMVNRNASKKSKGWALA